LGIWLGAQTPNPQSPIPNPQSQFKYKIFFELFIEKIIIIYLKNIYINDINY